MTCSAKPIFKSFWDWRLMEFPEFATFIGVHDYDGRLQSYTLKSIENRKATVVKYLEEASLLLLKPGLKDEDKLDLQYFISDLGTFLKGQNCKGYFFALSYLDGIHLEFERLLDTMKQHTEADYLKILDRLTYLPQQISEIIEIMREGMKQKMTFHSISVSGVLKQLDLLQASPEKSIFYRPFASMSEDIIFSSSFCGPFVSCSSKEELLSKALTVIKDNVLPSFEGLKKFLEEEYFKHLRPEIAISSIGDGKALYQSCLDYHLSCHITAEEVYQTGVNEVERISKKMEQVIESFELKMSVQEFSEHIRGDSDFCFNNVEELLEAYRGAIFTQIEPKLNELFNYTPKSKLRIEISPASQPNAPGAYYYAGTIDGTKPGVFTINATDLKASPKYDVMTLSLHEAIPGHHLQASYLIENETMPDFRRFLEDRRYAEAPSLFPFHTAYVEGWGLYCEHLGYELGLYDDAYLEYGHLSYEMLRACRLVVDTGIHMFGWTRDKAVDYMLAHTALHLCDIENEVNRYITWPGQACGYKIGEIKIKSLREQAEKALGSKFDIREFHDVVLQSFGPLNLLEQRVVDYIQRKS